MTGPDHMILQDTENDHIYHSELFTLTKRMAKGEPQKLSFTVPIFEPHPPQYYIHAVSDSWLHAESFYTISLHNLALPEVHFSLKYCKKDEISWIIFGTVLIQDVALCKCLPHINSVIFSGPYFTHGTFRFKTSPSDCNREQFL